MILLPKVDWQAVVSQLKRAKRIMLTTHRNPDADGIGSQLALYDCLKSMGKDVSIYNRDAVPRICKYLPSSDVIRIGDISDINGVDTVVALDAGAFSRLGFTQDIFESACLINIDHHASNPLYGNINVVNADYCATGAMVFDLIQHLGESLSYASATSIYAAVLTDTASFHLDRVTADVHRMTAELIEAGAEPSVAADAIYDSQPLARLSLLTLSLQTLSIENEGCSAWTHVTQEMQDETGADHEDSEGFIDVSRSIDGVKIVVFIRPESENRWKVSFRGKEGFDVGKVASTLGGGGHRYASGCAVSGSLNDVYAKVRVVVDDAFKV